MFNKISNFINKYSRLYCFNSLVIIGWVYFVEICLHIYISTLPYTNHNLLIGMILGFMYFILFPIIGLIIFLIGLFFDFKLHLKIKDNIITNKLFIAFQIIGFIIFIIIVNIFLLSLIQEFIS